MACDQPAASSSVGTGAAPSARPRRPVAVNHTSKYVNNGLKSLGINTNGASSVFHEWALAFPEGMFDGHRSAMPSPDHLFFMGFTPCLVCAFYAILPAGMRLAAEVSLRDALSRARLNRTIVYDVHKSKPYTGKKISESAAVLAAAPLAFARVLPTATMSAAMGVVMGVLKKSKTLIGAIYAYPRVDLDGADACRARTTHATLLLLADDFISAVAAACLRPDYVELAKLIDVPNLHRMRVMVAFSVPALAHVRHTVELAFESSHQPLKRAMVRGNGHDDAKRAMMRVVEGKLASRLRMEQARLGIPDDWTAHAGVNEALKNAMPLWSQSSAPWRLTGAIVLLANVPQQDKDVAASPTRVGATLAGGSERLEAMTIGWVWATRWLCWSRPRPTPGGSLSTARERLGRPAPLWPTFAWWGSPQATVVTPFPLSTRTALPMTRAAASCGIGASSTCRWWPRRAALGVCTTATSASRMRTAA